MGIDLGRERAPDKTAVCKFRPLLEKHRLGAAIFRAVGKQWRFGMKAPIGVNAETKRIHSPAATAANVHDSRVLGELLHGNKRQVWGDSAYQGQGKTIRRKAPQARGCTQQRGRRQAPLSAAQRKRNRVQAKVRCKVERPFQVMKRVFGFSKARYRGLAKNTHRAHVSCALVNLFLAGSICWGGRGVVRPEGEERPR